MMRNFTKYLLTCMIILLSSSLLWSQMITTSGKGAFSYTPATRATLYEQAPTSIAGFASQEFEAGFAAYSCEGADDFVVPTTWTIQTVTIWGTRWNGTGAATNIVNVNFYNDNGGVPANSPFQSFIHLACTNSGVWPAITYTIALPSNVTLAPGTYWLGVAERADFGTVGQFGRCPVSTVTNTQFYWINPGGGFGYGTGWIPGSGFTGQAPQDLSFRLEGIVGVPVSCEYTVNLYDAFGDGWTTYGGPAYHYLNVLVNGVVVLNQITLPDG